MTDIQVFLFGSDLPPAGQRARCVVNQEGIHIQSAQFAAPSFIKWRELQAKVAGFDHDRLQLTWPQEGTAWSLIPADAAEQKKLIAVLPQNGVAGLVQWQRETQSQSWLWKGILYTTAFVVVALLLLVWQHDRAAMWAANRVSMKTEKSLGESVLKSLNPKANFLSEGEAVKTVQRIGQQLTAGSRYQRYQYQWYVSKDPAVNAFAIPGGIIVVNSGLLKHADTPNELAAVLAHEVQHVEQRHALKNMMNSAAIATVVLVVLGDANAVVMMVAHQLSSQYFGRQVESDADIKGVQLLHDKHIDAQGMVSFFKKLESGFDPPNASKEEPSEVISWLSSHPDTRLRIQAIESYIAQHPCKQCTVLTWDKPAILAELERSDK